MFILHTTSGLISLIDTIHRVGFGLFFSPVNYHACELGFSNSLILVDLPGIFGD